MILAIYWFWSQLWVLLIFRLTPAMYQVLLYFTSVWACDSLTNGCSSFSSPYSALGHPGETILCTCYLWFSLNIMLLVGSGLSCKERTGQKWIDFFLRKLVSACSVCRLFSWRSCWLCDTLSSSSEMQAQGRVRYGKHLWALNKTGIRVGPTLSPTWEFPSVNLLIIWG